MTISDNIHITILILFSLYIIHNDLEDIKHPMKINPINIDLPEEYKAISKNPNNKTMLQGYIKHDTLFIEFKH